ncbi:MAG: complement resistance protein TraT [Nitrospira sp.]
MASNSLMLAPSTVRTVFLQNRNSSDNQDVSLHDLGARLGAKGYQVVQDPQAAAYVVLTNIVYCNQTKIELPVEDMVAGGYGSGIGSSIMSGLHGLTGMASMAGPQGALVGGAASLGLNAAEGIGNAMGSMFGGSSRPNANENINYACIADLQITDLRATGGSLPVSNRARRRLPGFIKPGWRPTCIKRNLMSWKPRRWCSNASVQQWQGTFDHARQDSGHERHPVHQQNPQPVRSACSCLPAAAMSYALGWLMIPLSFFPPAPHGLFTCRSAIRLKTKWRPRRISHPG